MSSNATLTAPPGTDLWRKPPSTNSINIPSAIQYGPIQKFKRAQVTVQSNWTRLYDQGGLVLYVNSPGLGKENYESWVKTGIEQFDGKPNVGTVATPPGGYSDWSLVPMQSGETSATIQVARQPGEPSLYVYLVEGEHKKLIREVTWVFQEKHNQELGIGVYAARPTKLDGDSGSESENLVVDFEGLVVEWTS